MTESAPHDGQCATDAGPDFDRPDGAIAGAGAAFHAAIVVRQAGLAAIHDENAVGTDVRAQSAARAFFGAVFQGGNVFQVMKRHGLTPHPPDKNATAAAARPSPPAASMTGTAAFISATTPERDVNVDDPVKFIARKAESDGRSRR